MQKSNLLAGEIVVWGFSGPGVKFSDVRQAIQNGNFDKKLLRDRLPRHAFARACHKMAEDRHIVLVSEDTDYIKFQFTAMKRDSAEIRYQKETVVSLDKKSGRVSSSIPTITRLAEQKLAESMGEFKSADMTALVQRVFNQKGGKEKADIFPIRRQGGAYFVPQLYSEFVDRAETLVQSLRGTFDRWPIAAGTPAGAKAIKNAVMEEFRSLAAEYGKAIEEFGDKTKEATRERMARHIKELQFKLDAYKDVLGDYHRELCESKLKLDAKLREATLVAFASV